MRGSLCYISLPRVSFQGASTRRWLVHDAIAAAEASSRKQLEMVKEEARSKDKGEDGVEPQVSEALTVPPFSTPTHSASTH